ncbi:MAG TPA: GAF domain-containing protein [Caulobacteraceae bacterium]|jgi:phosphoribosyl 1,2-cyclic phosphodiesterase|nr:GAF domain-containing protein [Caulobacteraceae bacterium]
MKVRFYGTRGSIATPGQATLRYGGNTSCVAVQSDSGTLVILDIGTGASVIGRELMAKGGPLHGHILIGHTHWDHIQGLPFFPPLFVPGNEWDIYAPRGLRQTLRETLAGQMQHIYFPVDLDQLGANIQYHELIEGSLQLGDINVTAQYMNHPALTLGYRLEVDGATLVYACDHEPFAREHGDNPGQFTGQDLHHARFLADADLLIHDAQYAASEYAGKVGWGHSTMEYAIAIAKFAGVKRVALTHHDPTRTDDALDALMKQVHAQPADGGLEIFAASEGQEIELRGDKRVTAPAAPAELPQAQVLTGGAVLLAVTTPARIDTLKEALSKDELQSRVTRPEDAAGAVAKEAPNLLIIEDFEGGEAMQIARTVRALPNDPPVVLISPATGGSVVADGLFDDRLVEPFSTSYARARLRAALMRRVSRWRRADMPPEEAKRVAALKALNVLDTAPEERFDRITRLAAALFDTPVALISLVDANRQWFKSSCGIPGGETPRDESFCAHAVVSRKPLVIPDALLDDRFADNPIVTGPARVRFYAGSPLFLSDGSCIGTLCVLDVRPRDFNSDDIARLGDLAELAREEFERQPAATDALQVS